MRKFFTPFFLLLFLTASAGLQAQLSCFYTLELNDTFGDGWNGNNLIVTVDGVATTYTIINDFTDPESGSFESFEIPVTEGDSILIFYDDSGAFQNEVTYQLLDSDGEIVFADGTFPDPGQVYADVASCPTCVAPRSSSVFISRIRSFSANVNWRSSGPTGQTYLLVYGFEGFDPTDGTGTEVLTQDTMFRIQPLQADTTYDIYLTAICPGADTANYRGPFSVTTQKPTDVGISAITMPDANSCELGQERLRVAISNFGGVPQTFIPFSFSINDVPVPVPMPQDGLYTGVVGVDSTDIIDFDTPFDFSSPGTYIVKAWTELENDTVLLNDTFTVVITNSPIISNFPYFQDFENDNGQFSVVRERDDLGEPSWEFGKPNAAVINSAASGMNAWVTNLDGPYNPNERSYLYSPCFDFSSLDVDPVISFQLNIFTPTFGEEFFLESTIDGGATWTKVGTSGTGLNWYNDTFGNFWDGTGPAPGWNLVFNTLTGLAGQADARLRFVFVSSGFTENEGAAVDDIYVGARGTIDAAAAKTTGLSVSDCGTDSDTLTIRLANLGTAPVGGFSVNYRVNGGAVVTEVYPDTLQPLTQAVYQFMTPYDGTLASVQNILAWTDAEGDEVSINDTTSTQVRTVFDLPLVENFEDGVAQLLTLDNDLTIFAPGAHNNPTFVVGDNVWSGDRIFRVRTKNIGTIQEGDSLFFDYRFADWSAGLIGTELDGDSLAVRIYADCSTMFTTALVIDSTNHTTTADFTTVSIDLSPYAGSNIQVEFLGGWGDGSGNDYWLELDNINLFQCPSSLGVNVAIDPASTNGSSDGSISVSPGLGQGPFTFDWSSPDSTVNLEDNVPFQDGLPTGNYTVAITDGLGCSQTLTLFVDFLVGANDFDASIGVVRVAPNPTRGQVELLVQLTETNDLRLELFSSLGQPLFQRKMGRVDELRQSVDLSDYPAGIYFLRVWAGDRSQTLRVIKSN